MAARPCLYYYHGAAGESLQEPNAFLGRAETLADFLAHFPAPETGLHFRFQADDARYGFLWVDVTDPSSSLPTYRGQVMAQVLRLGQASRPPQKLRLQRKAVRREAVVQYRAALRDAERRGPPPAAANPRPTRTQTHRPVGAPVGAPRGAGAPRGPPRPAGRRASPPGAPRAAGTRPTPGRPRATPVPSPSRGSPARGASPAAAAAATGDLMGTAPAAPPAPKKEYGPGIVVDDIDDDGDVPAGAGPGAASGAPANGDLMGTGGGSDLDFMVNPTSAAPAAPAAAAAAGATSTEASEEAFRVKHAARVRQWATANGKPKSLMALLSSMDQVLYENARWKNYSLADLLEPRKVRIAYLKAQQVVHTDKIQKLDLPLESQVIASLVCSSLNEAYEVFKDENGL